MQSKNLKRNLPSLKLLIACILLALLMIACSGELEQPPQGEEVHVDTLAQTLAVRIAASSDDAKERSADGSISITSTNIELVDKADNQTVGFRFRGVEVPKGAVITKAYIQFKAGTSTEDTPEAHLTIQGQAHDNAPTFTTSTRDITSRTRTSASVPWSPPRWTVVNEVSSRQRTPNIAPVIQEIVSREGWSSGNALAIIFSGSGRRNARSFDGDQVGAPLLVVEYSITYTLNVGKDGSGAGVVTSNPAGIDCGSECSKAFSEGAVVTLTASPATGSTFAGWSGACTGVGSCAVTMDGAKAVNATFNEQPSLSEDLPDYYPAGVQPTLLAGYWQIMINGKGGIEQQVRDLRYLPRQFDVGIRVLSDSTSPTVTDPGPYRGYDLLRTRNHVHANVHYPANHDFVFLRLNRDARVVVVWNAGLADAPSWLTAWPRGADVIIGNVRRPTFVRTLPKGEHYLKTIGGKHVPMYAVLLAEADGKPSAEPVWKAEWGERVRPNKGIPRDHILHNLHFALGPDGKKYPTWHPQIDPVYWFYFRHDHGSNPENFAGFSAVQPVWAYTDPSIKDDQFFAFKVLTFTAKGEDGRDYSFMFTFHAHSLLRDRICKRFHTTDLAIADAATGEVLARLHFLGDTGRARGVTSTGDKTIRPAECPTQDQIGTSVGRRNINVLSAGAYEAWQYDFGYARSLPIVGNVALMMEQPLTVIGNETNPDGSYSAARLISVSQPMMGASRHMQFSKNSTFGIDARQGSWGHFCTDRYGRERISCSRVDAVQQYVKPGAHVIVVNGSRWGVQDAWKMDYLPTSLTDRETGGVINVWRNLENAIQLNN